MIIFLPFPEFQMNILELSSGKRKKIFQVLSAEFFAGFLRGHWLIFRLLFYQGEATITIVYIVQFQGKQLS